MGGTSADVSLLKNGTPAEINSQVLAGFPVRMPALDVNAVGAGGGSIAWIDTDDLLKVGPQSAGADPGPACYGGGGEAATVTDANVLLGRLNGDALLDGRMPIRRSLAEESVTKLATRLELEVMDTALGIVQVACATVVKAIRKISVERGYDPKDFALVAFGGAGPLLGNDVARGLGIRTVIVPPSPGILCAEGLLNCDLATDLVRTALLPLNEDAVDAINEVGAQLAKAAETWFDRERVPAQDRRLGWTMELRYRGQNFELSIPFADQALTRAACRRLMNAFHHAHRLSYGFASPGEPIEFVSMKLKAVGLLAKPALPTLPTLAPRRRRKTPNFAENRQVVFARNRSHRTPIRRRDSLSPGQTIRGPMIIEQLDATTLIYPSDRCTVDGWGNLIISLSETGLRIPRKAAARRSRR